MISLPEAIAAIREELDAMEEAHEHCRDELDDSIATVESAAEEIHCIAGVIAWRSYYWLQQDSKERQRDKAEQVKAERKQA